MPEWDDRIRALRTRLHLTQGELADLLGMSESLVTGWEINRSGATGCWEKVIGALESDPEGTAELLLKASERPIDVPWPARFQALEDKIGLTNKWLAELLDVHLAPIVNWKNGLLDPSGCAALMFRILEVSADSDPETWPTILRIASRDVLTAERIKVLRLSLMLRQRDLANLLHITAPQVSCWEHNVQEPGWCSNLLLRMMEMMPGPTIDLIERIPWADPLSAQDIVRIREQAGLTQIELSRLFQADHSSITRMERMGSSIRGCNALVYRLLERYRDEFVSLIDAIRVV
jgi:DNA-binding transcriptional regulator YiaG